MQNHPSEKITLDEQLDQINYRLGRIETLLTVVLPLALRRYSRAEMAQKLGVTRQTILRREQRARAQFTLDAPGPHQLRRKLEEYGIGISQKNRQLKAR